MARHLANFDHFTCGTCLLAAVAIRNTIAVDKPTFGSAVTMTPHGDARKFEMKARNLDPLAIANAVVVIVTLMFPLESTGDPWKKCRNWLKRVGRVFMEKGKFNN